MHTTRSLLLAVRGSWGICAQAKVITGSTYGFIHDDQGAGLPGSTSVAVHQPTGSQYGVITRAEGEFNLATMRIGGPYAVTVSYVSYQSTSIDNVFLSLGQKLPLNLSIRS